MVPKWFQHELQMGSKSVPKPLPTWTFIRCCFLSLLGASWRRLSVVLGEAGGPFLQDTPIVLRDFQNYKLRSSRASGVCSKGLLGLILEPFWEPCWGQVEVKMELLSETCSTRSTDNCNLSENCSIVDYTAQIGGAVRGAPGMLIVVNLTLAEHFF